MRPAAPPALIAAAAAAAAAGDWATAEHYAHLADQATPSCVAWQRRRLDAAHAYAAAGQPVFPLAEGEKRPLPGSHGLKDATLDPDQITAWWGQHPEHNIGIVTGVLFDVIDIDAPEGQAWWDALDSRPPVAGVTLTPRGRHYWTPATGEGNHAGIVPHVDYRGTGGYVVAPPSHIMPTATHPGGLYRWHTNPYTGTGQQVAA